MRNQWMRTRLGIHLVAQFLLRGKNQRYFVIPHWSGFISRRIDHLLLSSYTRRELDPLAMSLNGYEQVPDVESGNGAAAPSPTTAASYADLPEDQGQLMAHFDSAAASASLEFEMPQADPSELVSQGQSMVRSMVTPTVSALCTFAGGMLLGYQAQYSSLASLAVLYFPYINAVIQFAVSINPLQNRLSHF